MALEAPTEASASFDVERGEQRASQNRNSNIYAISSAFVLGMMVATISLLIMQHYALGDVSFAKLFFAPAVPRVQAASVATGTSVGAPVSNNQRHHLGRASPASIHQPIPTIWSQQMSISPLDMEHLNPPTMSIGDAQSISPVPLAPSIKAPPRTDKSDGYGTSNKVAVLAAELQSSPSFPSTSFLLASIVLLIIIGGRIFLQQRPRSGGMGSMGGGSGPMGTMTFSPYTIHHSCARSSIEKIVGGKANGPQMMAADAQSLDAFKFSRARSAADLDEAADFFVDAFWVTSTTTSGTTALTRAGRSRLVKKQREELHERYGELVGQRRLSSEMLLARNADGAVVGCIGLEIAVVNMIDEIVVSRSHGEQMFKAEFAAMSPLERKQFRKMPLQELAIKLLEPGYQVCPLLANLAVSSSCRGLGLGRELCAQVEERVAQWGYGGIVLQAEEGNKAAVGLYSSLGYIEVFRKKVQQARTQSDGELTSELVNLLTFSKPVG